MVAGNSRHLSVVGTRPPKCSDYWEKIVVTELLGVVLLVKIFSDASGTRFIGVASAVGLGHSDILSLKLALQRVQRKLLEANDFEEHPPHFGIEYVLGLGENGSWGWCRPFECALITRDAESHLYLPGRYAQVPEKSTEVGTSGGVHDREADVDLNLVTVGPSNVTVLVWPPKRGDASNRWTS